MLIDWLLTMHSFDSDLLIRFQAKDSRNLRKKAAKVILDNIATEVSLTDWELEYLLVVTPFTFRWGEDDCGFSLKSKLLSLLLPPKIDWSFTMKPQEVDYENSNSRTDSSPTEDKTKDSTESGTES